MLAVVQQWDCYAPKPSSPQKGSFTHINHPHTMSTPNNTAPDFGEPWQNELGDFEIYPRTGGDAIAYAEGAKTRDRIIACVNACRGMADPWGWIEHARKLERELNEARHCAKKIRTAWCQATTDGSANEDDWPFPWENDQDQATASTRLGSCDG